MPTKVRRHISHSRTGKPEVVRSFVRKGPEHTAKWRRLVARLKRENPDVNPYAVASARLGEEGTFGRRLRENRPRGTKRIRKTFYRRR